MWIFMFLAALLVVPQAFADSDERILYMVALESDSLSRFSIPQHKELILPQQEYLQPRYNYIPAVPADPEIDPKMPRLEPDNRYDAKMQYIYPHVGKDLLYKQKPHGHFNYQINPLKTGETDE